MNQNGRNGNVAVVDKLEDATRIEDATAFYDPNDPALQPAKEIGAKQRRTWKWKLIGWSLVLLLIGGGVFALYFLLRVNRVNVRVQADSPREAQTAKPKTDGQNSEDAVTAEAIRMAREASGLDSGTTGNRNALSSTSSSPTPTPSPQYGRGPYLAYTGKSSPATDRMEDNGSKQDQNQQQGNTNQTGKPNEFSTPLLQSHANVTQSISVEDFIPKITTERGGTPSSRTTDKATLPSVALKPMSAVLPPFGTMLPVRTQGVIFTLRNSSYARLELTRDCAGPGWSIPKGTILVGRTSGSETDRAFVSVVGFIDPRDNKFVKMTGEVMGADGASGIPGKRVGVDRNRLKETLRKVASSGIQVAGTMAGALTGRGTVVIDSAGYRLLNPLTSDARGIVSGSDERHSFVKVEAGRSAYVMVADLPKPLQSIDAPGDEDLAQAAHTLTDREVMELILFGTPVEIRTAFPLMNEEQKKLAVKSIGDKQ
jgi:hypothetical protein